MYHASNQLLEVIKNQPWLFQYQGEALIYRVSEQRYLLELETSYLVNCLIIFPEILLLNLETNILPVPEEAVLEFHNKSIIIIAAMKRIFSVIMHCNTVIPGSCK